MTTDAETRAAFMAGLRALADFLEAHPDAPVPLFGAEIYLSTHGTTDDENRRLVDEFATLTGAEPAWTNTDTHYKVVRAFGPVEYAAGAVTSAHMAEYAAHQSYAGCVQPEAVRAA